MKQLFRPRVGMVRWLLPFAITGHALLLLTVLADAFHWPFARRLLQATFVDARRAPGPGADFFALYHAGERAASGQSVYTISQTTSRVPYGYPYRYLPPTAQTLGRALAQLPPFAAYLVWIGCIELSLLVFLRLLWRTVHGHLIRTALSAALLLAAPYWLELYMGQFTFVAAALTVAAVLRLQTGSRSTGGVLWAAAAQLKVFPLIMAVALVRSRSGRFVALLVPVALVAVNAPGLLADPLSGDAFWNRNFVGEPAGLDSGNHSVVYAAYLAGVLGFGGWHLPTWGEFTMAWRLVVLGAAVFRVISARRPALDMAAGLLLLAHFASYFQVWEHHLSAVVVAGALVIVALQRRRAEPALQIALLAILLLALPSPAGLIEATGAGAALALGAVLTKAVPVLLLLAFAMVYTEEPGRPAGCVDSQSAPGGPGGATVCLRTG